MPKIAMIGAGSIVFNKQLMMDIMGTEALADSHFALMDPDKEKLERSKAFAQRVVKENKLPSKITATTSRRKALDGADYVVIMIQVGGVDAFRKDYEIPLKYGVDQCIGDSLNPGGIFRALRTVPVLVAVARDMEQVCPDALMLNYANPMAAVCYALGEATDIRFVGLCHGVQATLDLISGYVGVPKPQIDFLAAGINHMAWFLRLEHNGRDLYPKLRRVMEKPEYYINEKVRGEVMRHVGYFMTESTGHLSEYLPYFRKNRKALKLYCDQPSFGGESGAYYKWCRDVAEKFAKVNPLDYESPALEPRSAEYCSHIMEACETGRPFHFNGNVRNDGLIMNLTPGCCVEVPVYADRTGLHATHVGDLPPQCAALCQSNVTCQDLTARAALTGDPEHAMHAVMTDPLTMAVLTLAEIREMTAEMLEAHKAVLPQFKRRKLRSVPKIDTPRGTKAVAVPVDPALAIGKRFVKLIEMKT